MTSPLLAIGWVVVDEREKGCNPLVDKRIGPVNWGLVLASE
jgi:hypothetical protein